MKTRSLTLRSLALLALALLLTPALPAQSIVGSWLLGDATQADSVSWVSFLGNGTYYLGQDGIADSGGHDGMERGTYTWNSNSLSTVVVRDTNGDWGLSTFTQPAFVTGNILDLGSGLDLVQASRIVSSTNPLVGSWVSADTFSVITFLANGYYLEIEDGVADNADGGPGIERGTYDFVSGALTVNTALDTSGDWGIGSGTFAMNLTGDTLTLEGATLTRVGVSAVPEPSTYAIVCGGIALVGAILRRRRTGARAAGRQPAS